MGRYLVYFLVLTGLGAIFTLAAPGLVYGLAYIGVGLILVFTPTAFMWGCIFAVGYALVRIAVRPLSAMIVAGVVTAVTLWAIPQPSIRAANAALAQFHLDDVTPADPIRLEGDIRIEMMPPSYSGEAYGCDGRCIAILLEPGVRSVTITQAAARTFEQIRSEVGQPDLSSRTYRLVPRAQCGNDEVELDARRLLSPFGRGTEEQRAVAAEWSMKLATEYCLTAVSVLKHYDMILRSDYWQSREPGPPRGFDMSPNLSTAKVHVADIRNSKGEVLFRRFLVAADALSVPFMIFPEGEGFTFGWLRKFRPDYDQSEWRNPDAELNAAIVVKRSATIGDSVANARNAVQVSFVYSTVATGQSATLVIENYMETLAKAKPAREDVVLIEQLLRDPRLGDLPGAWSLLRIFSADQLNSFLPAIISKLSRETTTGPALENALGLALERWPKAAFANPDHETLALLKNPDLRIRASGLVARLSDMGERSAPLLADIVEQHLPAIAKDPVRGQLHRRTASAAIRAMCRLGMQAASELPRMREIEKNAGPVEGERVAWDTMMLRIGKPLTEIGKFGKGGQSEQQYVSGLKNRLAHFDANQDCR